jgi:hypothetical protein
MLPLSRIHRGFHEAGALNALVNLYGFVDDRVFLTKSGELGVVLRLAGADDECLPHDERDRVARRFESALRLCDDHIRLLQFLLKRDEVELPRATHADPAIHRVLTTRADFVAAHREPLSSVELYLVVLSDAWTPHRSWASTLRALGRAPVATVRDRLSARGTVLTLDDALQQARDQPLAKVESVGLLLDEVVSPSVLTAPAAFQFFRQLLNYDRQKATVVPLLESTPPRLCGRRLEPRVSPRTIAAEPPTEPELLPSAQAPVSPRAPLPVLPVATPPQPAPASASTTAPVSAAPSKPPSPPAPGVLRLLEGTIIEAVLTTRLDGSQAGPVACLVTTPVFSTDYQTVLIPPGSRLLGTATPVERIDQHRLVVTFHRLLLHHGRSVSLERVPGLNQAGDIGLQDQVNHHYASLFGAFLTQFVVRHYCRLKATVREQFAQSLYLLDGRLADGLIDAAKKSQVIETFLVKGDEEVDVEVRRVALEDLRQPPYKATIDFDKVHYTLDDHRERRRETFTAHVVFGLKDQVPNALIPVDPLGLTITYFRDDQAFR